MSVRSHGAVGLRAPYGIREGDDPRAPAGHADAVHAVTFPARSPAAQRPPDGTPLFAAVSRPETLLNQRKRQVLHSAIVAVVAAGFSLAEAPRAWPDFALARSAYRL